MTLEFEIEHDATSRQYVYYKVLRKGLEVGTLVISADPYENAIKKEMILK